MKKIAFLILVLTGINSFLLSQEKNDTLIYFDKHWSKVDAKDSAVYYRIVKDYHLRKTEYEVKDYFMSGKLQMETHYLAPYSKNRKTGICTWYFENGQKSIETGYDLGEERGPSKEWYNNGQMKEEGNYEIADDQVIYKTINAWDSNAVQTLKDGQGFVNTYTSGKLTEVDNYKSGILAGACTGYYKNGKLYYEEEYVTGDLVKGVGYDSTGAKFKYKERFEFGMTADEQKKLNNYLGQNIRYPREEQKAGVECRIILKFLINTKGEAEKIEVMKGGVKSMEEEAIRVVKSYKKFRVTKNHGIKISIWYSLPFNFRLT